MGLWSTLSAKEDQPAISMNYLGMTDDAMAVQVPSMSLLAVPHDTRLSVGAFRLPIHIQ